MYKESGGYEDWLAHSRRGLYGYDYQDAHRVIPCGQYDLLTVPSIPIHVADLKLADEVAAGSCRRLMSDLVPNPPCRLLYSRIEGADASGMGVNREVLPVGIRNQRGHDLVYKRFGFDGRWR